MSEHRLIVQTPQRARRQRILVAALVAVVLVAGWGLYMLGRAHGGFGVSGQFPITHQPELGDGDDLAAGNQRLRARNQRLSRQVAELKRAAEVNQVASAELRATLEELQSRVSKLKKNLAFYRGILAPKSAKLGLRVQDLTVARAGKPGLYDLQVTLIRPMGYDGDVAGSARISVQGVRDGERVQLDWSDIALESAPELEFSFKYYQRLGGVFRVPDDVQPTRLVLVLDSDADGPDAITRKYRWTEVTAPAH